MDVVEIFESLKIRVIGDICGFCCWWWRNVMGSGLLRWAVGCAFTFGCYCLVAVGIVKDICGLELAMAMGREMGMKRTATW